MAANATGRTHRDQTDAMAVRRTLVDEAGPRASGPAMVTGTVRVMTKRSEFMATVRPPGSRARMGCGGAAPVET